MELPTLDQVRAITDAGALVGLEDEIDRAATKIETDLEFRPGDDGWLARARSALTAHKIVLKAVRKQLHFIRADKKPAAKDPLEVALVRRQRAEALERAAAQSASSRERKLEQQRQHQDFERQRMTLRAIRDCSLGALFMEEARGRLSGEVFELIVDAATARMTSAIKAVAHPAEHGGTDQP